MKPILFHLLHEPIYSYPLMMGLGWGVGYNITTGYWDKAKIDAKALKIYFPMAFALSWIGAKIFFLIFSTPDKALDYGKEVNFWLGGGFVFYGGLVFAGLFSLIYFYLHKDLSIKKLGLLTPGVVLGHAIGRVGCLLAGCCFGDQCDLPFAVTHKGIMRHPVQIYESIGLVLIFFLLRKTFTKNQNPLVLLGTYLTSYGVLRFVNEFFRGDAIRGIYYGMSTSQWVSVALIILGVFSFIKTKQSQS